MLPHHLGRRQHQFAGNRIALLRHRAARTAAFHEGLLKFPELCRGHDHHVDGNFAQRAGDERQQIDGLGEGVPCHVPGGGRDSQVQLLGQGLLDSEALTPERGQGASRTCERHDLHARTQLGQPLLMAVEHRQPDCHLVAEGHGQRLLQVRPASHRRVAVLGSQIGQDATQFADVGLNDVQCRSELQHDCRVHDVLRGRSPVKVAPRLAGHLDQLMQQREDGKSDEFGFLAEPVEVDTVQA